MSLLKFLKGIFSPKKVAETPVTIAIKSPEVFPPLVNQPVEEEAKVEPEAAPQETAKVVAEPKKEAKTVKDIKSKSKKAEAPQDAAKPKPKPNTKSKPPKGESK